MKKFTIGLVQMNSGPDVNENMRMAEQSVAEAVRGGASFILFPETSEYIGKDLAGHASGVPGYVSRRFSSLAKRYGVYLHCGSMTVRNGTGMPSNTSFLFGPDGETRACYSKLHMFDVDIPDGTVYRESDEIAPGNEIVMADTELGMFGFSICYDLRFPELYRLMAVAGAEILLVSANFTHTTGEKHWETLLRARAIENACYVVAAGQCGTKASFDAYGHSMIIDPFGEILAVSGERPEVLLCELDPDVLTQARNQIPALMNRRDDIYELYTDHLKIYE
ncbi:MAG: carbon-nitrogen hydrolase family protein [Fusicatenibacter sp.]|nr:carbon-nitrogen hydrolase family protein [Fusicatenibacter sp.]